MKALIVGRSGQLARALSQSNWPAGVQPIFAGRPEIDARDRDDAARLIAEIAPHVLINTSAYTAVDKAESERNAAFALNTKGAWNLANIASAEGIPLIHISTDYVFSGPKARAWHEDDPIAPQGVYAQSKWDGEEAIREALKEHVIVRASWLFSACGTNFVRTMMRLAKEKSEIPVVDDQRGCPTWAGDLARVLIDIATKRGPWGTYHYCGAGQATWADFAAEVFARTQGKHPLLRRISTAEFAAPAPRPEWSVLDTTKILRDYGIEQRPWREGLDHVMQELNTNA